MLLLAMILVPALAAPMAYFVPTKSIKLLIVNLVAVLHTLATLSLWTVPYPDPSLGRSFGYDAAGLLFLTIVSVLFLLCTIASNRYLDSEHAPLLSTYCASLPLFLSSMTLACLTLHMGVYWVAIEATTLFSAPLIYSRGEARSLEATWKYLLLCSVGIALALLGTFFLAIASAGFGRSHEWDVLYVPAILTAVAQVPFQPLWLKASFILLLIGYGTKMGLAPMHNWLPDAHSEAPSPVSALLSGALLNCAFLGIIRGYQICQAASLGAFARDATLMLGVLSMVTAAIFMYRQADYKRMLAYSSIENMGILAIGLALGGAAAYGSMLHAVNHSVAKGLLFLAAGNFYMAYGSKEVADVRGAGRVAPVTAALWVAGFLAIAGTPPFGLFLSKFTILATAASTGRYLILAAMLLSIGIIFVGMSRTVIAMVTGEPRPVPGHEHALESWRETAWHWSAPLALGLISLVLGLMIPRGLDLVLCDAAAAVGPKAASTAGLPPAPPAPVPTAFKMLGD